MSKLTLRYDRHPDDDYGRLHVSVETPTFSGRSFCWAYPQTVIEYAGVLDAYPIRADAIPSIREGDGQCEGNDLVIGIEIKPADARGNRLVEVEIADELERSSRLKTTFCTAYAELEEFRKEIIEMMRGDIPAAVLVGSR